MFEKIVKLVLEKLTIKKIVAVLVLTFVLATLITFVWKMTYELGILLVTVGSLVGSVLLVFKYPDTLDNMIKYVKEKFNADKFS